MQPHFISSWLYPKNRAHTYTHSRSVTQGYNGSLLVYGQTGAGKTFTMSGGQGNYKTRGAIPRAIQEIFTEVQKKPQQVQTNIIKQSSFGLFALQGNMPAVNSC